MSLAIMIFVIEIHSSERFGLDRQRKEGMMESIRIPH